MHFSSAICHILYHPVTPHFVICTFQPSNHNGPITIEIKHPSYTWWWIIFNMDCYKGASTKGCGVFNPNYTVPGSNGDLLLNKKIVLCDLNVNSLLSNKKIVLICDLNENSLLSNEHKCSNLCPSIHYSICVHKFVSQYSL